MARLHPADTARQRTMQPSPRLVGPSPRVIGQRVYHVMVVYDGSSAARRALLEAAAIADEHDADISVVEFVPHERGNGRCSTCGISTAQWNRELDAIAEDQLAAAQATLAHRDPPVRCSIVSGSGPRAIRRAVEALGCDIVLFPSRGLLRLRRLRRVRRAVAADVIEVRAR